MAKKSLARAIRSQEAQINRINKMVNEMQQQGFTFNKQFLKSLKVTGTSASKAAAKAQKLKAITKSKLLNKVKSYKTDTGQVITGKRAGKAGALTEKRKRKQQRIAGLQNAEDALNNTVDAIHPNGKWHDLSSEKRELMQAWFRYKDNVTVATYDEKRLAAIVGYASEMIYPSDSLLRYDSMLQKIYGLLTGEAMTAEAIAVAGGEEI